MNEKIKWCLRKKEGISIVEPNENLSNEYRKEADNTLETMLETKGKWKIIMAYYSCYSALYSILIKAGIKCEIHSCSIALMGMIGFDKEDIKFMEKLKDDRTNVQYYLKEKELEDENKVKEFLLKCKNIGNEIDVQMVMEKIRQVKNAKK